MKTRTLSSLASIKISSSGSERSTFAPVLSWTAAPTKTAIWVLDMDPPPRRARMAKDSGRRSAARSEAVFPIRSRSGSTVTTGLADTTPKTSAMMDGALGSEVSTKILPRSRDKE